MKRLFLAMMMIAAAASTAGAQNTVRLGMNEAIDMAIKNNRQLEIARLAVETADAQVKEAYSSTLPTLTLNGRYTRNIQAQVFYFPGADGITRPIQIGSDNSLQTDLTVNQVVYNQAAFDAPNAAEAYASISRQQLRAGAADVVFGVKRAYYSALLAREALYVNESLLKNAEENWRNTQALHKSGLRAEFDALRAEVQAANQRPVVVQARDSYQQALDNLKLLLNMDPAVELELGESLAVPASSTGGGNVEPMIADALVLLERYNAQLEALRLSADVNRQFIDLRKSDYLPTLSVFGTYQLQAQADKFSELDFQPTSYVGLNLSFNLFNGWKTSSQVEQARLDYETSKLQLAQAEQALKTQLQTTLRTVDFARQRIETGAMTIGQAERAYKIATTSYKAGTGTQLDIANADLAVAQSKLNQLSAVYDYSVALAELEQLLGEHYQLIDGGNDVQYSLR